jgi:NAD(P)-dependent dehydrogenase (short-subunit alcohol dehydrogenase family)
MSDVKLDPAHLFDLSGKIAVITGGSRGLGRALVDGLAAAGADVVIASRKLDNCRRAASEVTESTGRRALPIACHVGHWDDCDRLVDTVYDHFGRMDVLVNNAGMSPLYPSLVEMSEELYDKTLAVNLKGPFRLSCLAAERMAGAAGGSIINISSIGSEGGGSGGGGGGGGRGGAAGQALPYACAKAGLNLLTVGLSRAYAPTVRVNAVLPGSFWTDVSRHWPDGMVNPEAIPLGRVADSREMVGAVIYLASEASSYTTGALLRVDGGVAAHA